MPIALSHGAQTIYSASAPSREVLVGTKEGIVCLERDGSGWREAGRTLTDRHISAIVIEEQSGLLFAGAYHGSVHVSADRGQTWQQCDRGLTQDDVYSLAAVRRAGGVRLYLGTEPAHLFYSDDLGSSWSEFPGLRDVPGVDKWSFPGPPHIAHLKHINVHPDQPDTMFGSIEVGALLKSTDAGQSWHELRGMYPDVHRTVIHPTNPDRIYVTGGDGIYVTSDGGASWEHWSTREADIGGYPDMLVFRPSNPDVMFVGAAHKSPGSWRETHFAGARISRSQDGGRTWEVLGNGLPDRLQASIEAMLLEDCGQSCLVMAATTAGEIWCSDDAGESWSCAVAGLAPISKAGHYRALVPA